MTLLFYVGTYQLYASFLERSLRASVSHNLLIGFASSFLIFKLIFAIFLAFEDVFRIGYYLIQQATQLFSSPSSSVSFGERRAFLVKLGLGIASLPFGAMLHGITKGKYNFQVKKIALKFPNLPAAFEGFRLVQISDVHSGSFDDASAVRRGVSLINEQKPDVVFFTGDLVNNDALEIEPYIAVFKSIKSPYGTYSILGNHDYGDYKKWPSKAAKEANLKQLETFQEQMNFTLLKNRHITLQKGADSLVVLGVENWGKPPFVRYGDLEKTMEGVAPDAFKILLSHDPSHWDEKALPHPYHIDLTLSGHTHGMQFGVDIPGFKWSPVKYKYPRWSGLYEQAKQYLYVNKGFGFLGFPGRVGMWPEITVIELKS